MKNRPTLLAIVLLGAIATSKLPSRAQPSYTPYNSYSPEMQNTQLRGAEDATPYQSPGSINQGPPASGYPQNNYPNPSNNKKNKHSKQKSAKVHNNKSAVGTVAGAPTKAAKAGVGLTDKTAKTGVGLTDRAAKVGVGAPAKAIKETFKAIF